MHTSILQNYKYNSNRRERKTNLIQLYLPKGFKVRVITGITSNWQIKQDCICYGQSRRD